MTAVAPPTAEGATNQASPRRLRNNALGFPALLGQSVALISPTMTAVLIIPLAFSSAGQGTWLAYLFATVMLMFVVANLNQFARRSASSGSMYSYTGRGLGPGAGVFSGWTLIWSYFFIAVAGLTGFAIFAAQFLAALGVTTVVPPIVFFALSAGACWYVACKDIRLSSILTLALEGISMALILTLAGFVLFSHGLHIDHAQLNLKGVHFHGMSLAVVACIFSLVGFESATALGGEARNPLRNVPRAVVWSLVIAGVFFVLMSYVEVAGTAHYKTTLDQIAAPLNVLSNIYGVSYFKIPLSLAAMVLAAMVSFFSLSLSCINAGSRIVYPMGEHMVLPKHLGRIHHVNATPHVAITCYAAGVLAFAGLIEINSNPLTTFNDAGTLAAFGFLLAYFLTTVAAPVYLRKLGQLRARNVVMAVASFVFLLVPTEGSVYPAPPSPVNLFPYIFLGYVALGGVLLYSVSRRHPGILAAIQTDMNAEVGGTGEPIDVREPTATAPATDPTFVPAEA